ncbi:hypothetical protein CIB84_003304 [Bambusicola thoracicus]|uniref:Uncharacterized protein n=1 Tax=Bambusicola thoracicus TaxID=9083 RepID=A0A2P4T9C1_BAMTH|nr:hypothetical protein CIB84_003304 [Bambusicola thoracicus]
MMLHDLLHCHREMGGNTVLPRTFESNEVLTPLQIPSPPTDFQDRYEEFREFLHHCRLPGGTEREHGGIVLPVLPEDHRAKDKSLFTLVRGHHHFGSGVFPWPRGLPIEQCYDVTLLKKSDVRMNDDLYYDEKCSTKKKEDEFCLQIHEVSLAPERTSAISTTVYILPRELEHRLSPRTTNILRNIERAQRITAYNQNFTGRGPMNPLFLDDYYMKAVGRLTGELGTDVELKETLVSSLSQVRLLEGRTACLLQGRHLHESALQKQHCCHKQAKPPQVSYQKDHCLDTGLPISKFQRIADRWQTEALYQDQFSGRPELQSLPKSARSCSCEDLKPKHLDQHTIWENPLSMAVLPQDENREESKIVLHKLWNQEASQPAWRPEDRSREAALPEWIPGSEVAWHQTVLLELQDSFSKTAAQKRFHDSINGETKDLRDNINEGRRHEFYGFNAFYFHN